MPVLRQAFKLYQWQCSYENRYLSRRHPNKTWGTDPAAISGIAMAFTGVRAVHPVEQNEEENNLFEEKWKRLQKKWGNHEEKFSFLSCAPGSKSLTTALPEMVLMWADYPYWFVAVSFKILKKTSILLDYKGGWFAFLI